ncbi:DUF6348 family protein [Ideonella sp. YS5]|uniref:DUF6348 family protein n=1 Tax=Ideonella sp. YS5 TaxID=3453714 RepID=UPI003EEF0C4E
MSSTRHLLICFLLLVGVSSATAGQGAEYVNSYFELWLKDHRFSDFEKRRNGIFFPSKGVLLDGEINEAKELKPGQLYSVESRISVTFKNGRRLDDFVAGAGTKADEAFYESLQNFCLTTLHPIYAELFDHSDPHVRKQWWSVRGVQRRVFLSEWGHRGSPIPEPFQKEVEAAFARELAISQVSKEIHWVKLVVLIDQGRMKQLVVTVDGERSESLIKKLASLAWPMPKDFSMAKLFFVVGEV